MKMKKKKKKVTCLQCGEGQNFNGASNDELGWHCQCKKCGGSFDIDITEHIVSNGTRVKVNNDWIGTIKGNDAEDTDEFENINYYVVPEGKTFDDEYMCPRSEFKIEDKKYTITLWQYDFAPKSSIDDLPEHHTFVSQIYFNDRKEFDELCDKEKLWDKYKGLTYRFSEIGEEDCIALGVFASDSLDDDFNELED